MYAIVATSGKQYRVELGQKLVVDRIDLEEGSEIVLDQVLMVGGDSPKVGTPTVAGAQVKATIVAHFKGDKVITFRYTRRRRTRKTRGFRHSHTTIEITSIEA